jgi:hypothetical protein
VREGIWLWGGNGAAKVRVCDHVRKEVGELRRRVERDGGVSKGTGLMRRNVGKVVRETGDRK